jgi:hypothetical protein
MVYGIFYKITKKEDVRNHIFFDIEKRVGIESLLKKIIDELMTNRTRCGRINEKKQVIKWNTISSLLVEDMRDVKQPWPVADYNIIPS